MDLGEPQEKYDREAERKSWIISLAFHAGVMLLFAFWTCTTPVAEEMVEIEWGGSGGIPGVDAPEGPTPRGEPDGGSSSRQSQPEPENEPTESVERPVTNRDPISTTSPTIPTETERRPNRPSQQQPTPATAERESSSDPSDRSGENTQGRPDASGDRPAGGSGGLTSGYGVDGFGSRGWVRSPRATAPSSTNEEGTVVLRFTVLPNGDVTNIVPIQRANSALTSAAMSALSRSRARALPPDAEQVAITATITYRFQLQ